MKENEFVVVLGRKGQGKTYFTRKYISGQKRIVYFDPMRQFSGCGVIIRCPYRFFEYLDDNSDRYYKIVFQPQASFHPGEKKNSLREIFMKICWAVSVQNDFYFVVDELHRCVSPGNRSENKSFMDFIETGRHRQQSIITTTLRSTGVSKDLLGQADKIVLFQSHLPNDKKNLKDYLGALVEELSALPEYHYIEYTPKAGARKCQPI